MNPSAALQSTVEDFLESLTQSPGAALADLVNCVLRACGSNDTVDSDRAVDYDGVVDALDDFTEVLKEVNLRHQSGVSSALSTSGSRSRPRRLRMLCPFCST